MKYMLRVSLRAASPSRAPGVRPTKRLICSNYSSFSALLVVTAKIYHISTSNYLNEMNKYLIRKKGEELGRRISPPRLLRHVVDDFVQNNL
ncbi:glycerate kinase [Sesbania bispinosa]|nr:glycerate kinase [Sesbania bispinosa]